MLLALCSTVVVSTVFFCLHVFPVLCKYDMLHLLCYHVLHLLFRCCYIMFQYSIQN